MNKFFAQPKNILNIHECSFYHTIELPTYGVIKGLWDLRAGIDAYIGKIDVKGKSFLDIGAASGFVCFEMEKKGAKVTGYDLSENDEADLIPWGGSIDSAIVMRNQQSKKKVNNSFWFSHRLLQ